MVLISCHTQSIEEAFREQGYITDPEILTALHLVTALKKPLLIEGPAGVGKTELAKVLAKSLNTRLIRLQCYEGLDMNSALYEWNYAKQMLHIRLTENSDASLAERESAIFSKPFLLTRPILDALTDGHSSPVLLIDEVDRADEEFEAFLLEALAESQITIPELGTIRAKHPPYVILTSNRTRELSDALRRRCLYYWVTYPDIEKESAILQARIPNINKKLTEQIVNMMQLIRKMPLSKVPGIAESLDWAFALMALNQGELDKKVVLQTLGCFIKDQEDWETVEKEIKEGNLLSMAKV
ncbi:MAG TPA: MoxR family ATPase [Bacillus bacterium]|uniref:AAA family ATPase n=1 Tax=Siminovitchia fordii TaxID=254759 RepID=UPI0003A80E94|nr:MoxR family ATPase [Siminovitchia fordii]HBZ11845.1 MoxR family ATPase [Bacillus sp. (in: firmicutes)]